MRKLENGERVIWLRPMRSGQEIRTLVEYIRATEFRHAIRVLPEQTPDVIRFVNRNRLRSLSKQRSGS